MSNFTPLVTRKYTFEGDEVVVTFARLKRKHMMELLPHLGDLKVKDLKKLTNVLNIAADFLPEYITSLQGLKDSEGKEISTAVVCEEVYFMQLAIEILMDLINESMIMDGKKAKNG